MSESESSHVSNSDSEDERILREVEACEKIENEFLQAAEIQHVHRPLQEVQNFEKPDSQEFLNLDTQHIGKFRFIFRY